MSNYINLETQNSNHNINSYNNNINKSLQKRLFTNDFIIEKPTNIPNFKEKVNISDKSQKNNLIFNTNQKKVIAKIEDDSKSSKKKNNLDLLDPLNINKNNSMTKDEMLNNYVSLKNIYDPRKGGNKIIFRRICEAIILLR